MIIAIDGTFASGKGTLGTRIAAHYNLPYLDTGKLYRAVAFQVRAAGKDFEDADAAAHAAKTLRPENLDEDDLRSAAIGAGASIVAAITEVRAALKAWQQDFAAQPGGAVLDGRDIGTVICPHADVKLFVDAKPEERARRRHLELTDRGEDILYATVLNQLRERDGRDAGRTDAPMKPADDAHLIDTTDLDPDQAFAAARRIVDAVQTRHSEDS